VDVNEIMRRVDEDLAAAEAQLRAAQGRVDELATVRDGLRLAVQRYGSVESNGPWQRLTESVERGTTRPFSEITQMEACLRILTELGRPATTQEVLDKLRSHGRPENYEQVRGALAYLLRKKRIKRVGPGLWESPTTTDATNDFAPAVAPARARDTGGDGTG
jgi:hypothetical protein